MSMKIGRLLGRLCLALVLVGSLAMSAHAESVLEVGDLVAHRRGGDVQFVGSAAEAQQPGGGVEGTQGREGRQFGHP